jgi:hypothetical protein
MAYFIHVNGEKTELTPDAITATYLKNGIVKKDSNGNFIGVQSGKVVTPNDMMQNYIKGNKDISFEADPVVDYARAIVQGALPGIRPISALAALNGDQTLEAMNPYKGKNPVETALASGSDIASQAYNLVGGPEVAVGKTIFGGATGAAAKAIADTTSPMIQNAIKSIPDKNIRKGVQGTLDLATNYALPAANIISLVPYAHFIPHLGETNINAYLKDVNTADIAREIYPQTQAPLSRMLKGAERFPYLTDKEKTAAAGFGNGGNSTQLAELSEDDIAAGATSKYERGNPSDISNIDLARSVQIPPKLPGETSQGLLTDYINRQNLINFLKSRDAAQISAQNAGKDAGVGAIGYLPIAPYETNLGSTGLPSSMIMPALNTLQTEESIAKNNQ